MNIFAALFGIFRQRGLVTTLKEGRPLGGFGVAAIVVSVLSGVAYGFAMGIGLGPETAIKDAIKVGLIVLLGLVFSLPVFWLAYRLLGREDRPAIVAAIPLTFVSSTAIVLAVTVPVVFLLSLLAGFSPEAIYIHVIIVDLALLVGLYMVGTLIYYGLTIDRSRLIVPNVVSFIMLAVILVVLVLFFSPFLSLSPTFSVGTDLFRDRLGIGVADRVVKALDAAAVAERLTYRFQTTNQNGDLTRDYKVTRVGEDYSIEARTHAVPGETSQSGRRIWIIDGKTWTDFADGRVAQVDAANLKSFLDSALPKSAFRLPDTFQTATWRGYESGRDLSAIGTTSTQGQVTLILSADTGRVVSMVIGATDRSQRSETRVVEVAQASLDRAGLQANLNQAMVLGAVDRSEASMQDYAQEQAFFVLRYPRTWRAGSWNATQRRVEFLNDCGAADGCPAIAVSTLDLAKNKGAKEYATDLGASLTRQPEYREIKANTMVIGDQTVGTVEYLFDRTSKGQIETTRHIEYIFVGSQVRYHLDGTTPAKQFDMYRSLFDAMARQFSYLR